LDYVEYTVYDGENQSGSEIIEWTTIASGISAASYTTDWEVNFSSLTESTTMYVSARAFDVAESSYTLEDAFYILKDTTPPTVDVGVSGDDAWRSEAGTAYDVNFYDTGGSKLDYAQYQVWNSTGASGNLIIEWTNIALSIGATN